MTIFYQKRERKKKVELFLIFIKVTKNKKFIFHTSIIGNIGVFTISERSSILLLAFFFSFNKIYYISNNNNIKYIITNLKIKKNLFNFSKFKKMYIQEN